MFSQLPLNCLINGVKGSQKYPESGFCICLHYHSPRAYEFFRKMFKDNLSGVSTIRCWYSNSCLNSGVGISDSCLNILKRKAEQQKSDDKKLLCSLVFDEMFIRQHTQWKKLYLREKTWNFKAGSRFYGLWAERQL